MFFFFNDTATTEIYTLSLHDALPISGSPTSFMCGISGLITASGKPIDRDTLERMTERLRHRGPDDGGIWTGGSGNVQVGLGNRRLSILDLSPRGHMPMASVDGRWRITYNGEIYNCREIRRELERSE